MLVATFLVTLFLSVSGDVDISVKQCREDWCCGLDHNDSRFDGPEYYDQLLNLFSSGIPQLIFHQKVDSFVTDEKISTNCKSAFKIIRNETRQGNEWAFRFVDTSAKIPPSFQQGTVAELGDYDMCLDIMQPDESRSTNEGIRGMYCVADIFPEGYIGKVPRTDGKVSLNQMQYYNDTAYYFGLCFPSVCSQDDVRQILTRVLEPFPLRVYGHMHCDTKDSISLTHRLKNMKSATAVSLLVITIVVSLVFYGTLNHIFRPDRNKLRHLKSFSLINNLYKLVMVDANSPPDSHTTLFANHMKMTLILFGIGAHIYTCIESPIALFLTSHRKHTEHLASNPLLIPLFTDAGIISSSSISGFMTFFMMYPLAKAKKLSVPLHLMLRVMRFAPVILCVNCLDMIWYLPVTGPFVTRVGQVIVDKCAKTWWRSVLFVNNLIGDSIEICSGHTYSLAIDIQLFILGLIAVILFSKKPALGLSYSVIVSLMATGWSYYLAGVYQLTPTMLTPRNPSIAGFERFLMYQHMNTSAYVLPYFSALILAYFLHEGNLNKYAANINHFAWSLVINLLIISSQFAPILTSTLDIIPQKYYPAFIVGIKVDVSTQLALGLTYVSLLDIQAKTEKEKSSSTDGESRTRSQIKPRLQISVWKMILRLGFSMYMSNYLLIRTDFFASRTLFPNSFYPFVKRVISICLLLIPWSIIYHLFFVAPFMSFVNDMIRKPKSA